MTVLVIEIYPEKDSAQNMVCILLQTGNIHNCLLSDTLVLAFASHCHLLYMHIPSLAEWICLSHSTNESSPEARRLAGKKAHKAVQ